MLFRGWAVVALGVLILSACQTTVERDASPSGGVQATAGDTARTLTQGEWLGYAAGDRGGYPFLGYFCDTLDRSPMRVVVMGNSITGTLTSALDGTVIPISWTFDGARLNGRVTPKSTADPRKVIGRLENGALTGIIISAGSSTCGGEFVLRPSGE